MQSQMGPPSVSHLRGTTNTFEANELGKFEHYGRISLKPEGVPQWEILDFESGIANFYQQTLLLFSFGFHQVVKVTGNRRWSSFNS
jgi:hypothetical protein